MIKQIELAANPVYLDFVVEYKSLNMRDYGEINRIRVKSPTDQQAEKDALNKLKAQGIYSVQILKVKQV